MGDVLHRRMAEIAAKHPSVGTHRNIGLFGIVELVRDREELRADGPLQRHLATRWPPSGSFFRENGLYTFVRWNTFFTNPPLSITEAQLEEGLDSSTRGSRSRTKAVRA